MFYTDRDGKLNIEGLIVPGIDPGTYALVVGVGEAEERTTASVNYTVIDEGLPQRAPVAVLEGLEPLGEKLVRVFRFNNATKTWEFYDPRPEFAEANTISQMFGGNVYWLNITEDTRGGAGRQDPQADLHRGRLLEPDSLVVPFKVRGAGPGWYRPRNNPDFRYKHGGNP